MTSGDKSGLFNLALAGLAAGASAFVVFAMPGPVLAAGLETVGLAQLIASPSGGAVRLGVMFAAAVLAFLIAWASLHACDAPRDRLSDQDDGDWPAFPMFAHSGCADDDPEDPFAALARGAERVDGPLELAPEQIVTAEPVPVEQVPLPTFAANRVTGLVQRLNMGVAASEWPIAPSQEEAEASAEDRLRGVLHDLHAIARRA